MHARLSSPAGLLLAAALTGAMLMAPVTGSTTATAATRPATNATAPTGGRPARSH